jgi:hypothetical protein
VGSRFRNPIDILYQDTRDNFLAANLYDAFGNGFIACFEQLKNDDDESYLSWSSFRDTVHEFREQLYLVMVTAFKSARIATVHPPGSPNEQLDEVLDYSEDARNGTVVEAANHLDVGDPDNPDFKVRWRLLRVDAVGAFVFGAQQCDSDDRWTSLFSFRVSANVMRQFSEGPQTVETHCKQFIVRARQYRLFSLMDGIARWCTDHEMPDEAEIVETATSLMELRYTKSLSQVVKALAMMDDKVPKVARWRRL